MFGQLFQRAIYCHCLKKDHTFWAPKRLWNAPDFYEFLPIGMKLPEKYVSYHPFADKKVVEESSYTKQFLIQRSDGTWSVAEYFRTIDNNVIQFFMGFEGIFVQEHYPVQIFKVVIVNGTNVRYTPFTSVSLYSRKDEKKRSKRQRTESEASTSGDL